MTPEARLATLGLLNALPKPTPKANYLMSRQSNQLLFLSGHIMQEHKGRIGCVEAGQSIAKDLALNLIGTLKHELGELGRIKQLVKVTGFVVVEPGFKEHSQVMDGASQLFLSVFGAERGLHARSAIGVESLPFGVSMEMELIAELMPE